MPPCTGTEPKLKYYLEVAGSDRAATSAAASRVQAAVAEQPGALAAAAAGLGSWMHRRGAGGARHLVASDREDRSKRRLLMLHDLSLPAQHRHAVLERRLWR